MYLVPREGRTPLTSQESSDATWALLGHAIKVLRSHNFNPTLRKVDVHMCVAQPTGPSVTGLERVRFFKPAVYDYDLDKIEDSFNCAYLDDVRGDS